MNVVPVTFRYPKLEVGKKPEIVEQTRHLYYDTRSMKVLFAKLGLDFQGFSNASRDLARQRVEAEKEGKKPEELQIPQRLQDQLKALMTVELDDLAQLNLMLWAGLITEDPKLQPEDVEGWYGVADMDRLFEAVMIAIAYFTGGEEGGEETKRRLAAFRQKGGSLVNEGSEEALGELDVPGELFG